MKTLLFLLLPALLSAQFTRSEWEREMQRRQGVFEKYEPGKEVARCLLPGLLGVAAGSINTDNTRGKVAQQAIMFGAVVSIGAWGERSAKFRFFEGLCFIGGFAIGAAINQKSR